MNNLINKKLFQISVIAGLVLINIVFTNLPLLKILSYESSAVNAVLFSLLSGNYWLRFKNVKNSKSHLYFFSMIILLPFLILSVSTVLCQHCPFSDGLLFYLLISLPSILVGISISEVANFTSKKFKYLLFIIIWLIVLLGFLPELYFNPQIYFYNPIFGYYPGVIYDQEIEIAITLVLYRAVNIIIALLIIWIINLKNNFNEIRKYIVIIGVILIYLIGSQVKNLVNFSTNLNNVKNELKEELITEHFNIIVSDSLSEREKQLLKYDHEYYYSYISELLGNRIDGKITSILFKTGAQKKRLFGSANADVAKPWLNQIYLDYGSYDKSLKHEIAHIFSAKYASGLFNIPSNFNPGMIEGFAMAIENNYDNYDIDYLATMAYNNNYRISLNDLFHGFSFFSNASSLSYIYAGSFIKYLADKYGWDRIKKVYSGQKFKSVYNFDIPDLEAEYYKYLEEYPTDVNPNLSNYYFGRLPLIKIFCARATAKELMLAYDYYLKKDYKHSAQIFLKIYKYSGTYSALIGYAQNLMELGEISGAIKLLNEEIHKFEGTAHYYYLEFLLADFYALNNDADSASNYYRKIIQQGPNYRYIRSAKIKTSLLNIGDSVLIKYIKDEKFVKTEIIELLKTAPDNNVLQILTVLKDIKEDEYLGLKENIRTAIKNNEYSSDTYFELSKFAYKFLDFDEAIIYAERALNSVDINKEPILREYLLKIKWIQQKNYIKTPKQAWNE